MREIQRDFINDTYIFHTVGLRKKRKVSIQQEKNRFVMRHSQYIKNPRIPRGI